MRLGTAFARSVLGLSAMLVLVVEEVGGEEKRQGCKVWVREGLEHLAKASIQDHFSSPLVARADFLHSFFLGKPRSKAAPSTAPVAAATGNPSLAARPSVSPSRKSIFASRAPEFCLRSPFRLQMLGGCLVQDDPALQV